MQKLPKQVKKFHILPKLGGYLVNEQNLFEIPTILIPFVSFMKHESNLFVNRYKSASGWSSGQRARPLLRHSEFEFHNQKLKGIVDHPKSTFVGQEPWSSGYGKRLRSKRLWVRILVLDTRWTFFHKYCC